jgi:Kdo2-lipid IVA lauroyltransferase/acyltransferase
METPAARRGSLDSDGDVTSATNDQSVAEPSAFCPNQPRAAELARRKSRQRLAVGELKLDFRSRILFHLMVGVLHLLSLLPDFVLNPLGIVCGYVGYQLDRRRRRIGMRNLAIAFPERNERERRRILCASYINLGRSGAEYVRLGGFFYGRLRKRVVYNERLDFWKELRQRHSRKGLLVLTAHLGNFELLPAAHAMYGYQIDLVHHTQRFAAGEALMTFVRERAGVRVIRKHAAARAVLRALQQGRTVGVTFDQNAKRSEAIFVPFFGEIASTSRGLARLVAITGAPVLPVFIVRQPAKRTHRIEIQDEIIMQRTGNATADIEENTRRLVKAVEDIARRFPEQFLWTHRRYRTRPLRGMLSVYDT